MYNIYIVSAGDTIESIAQKYNTTPQELYELNNILKPNEPLTVGLRLIVPTPIVQTFEYYTVQKGDTLYKIGQRYNINSQNLAEINGLEMNEFLYPGQVLLVPSPGVKVDITKSGDTIASISRRLGTGLEQLILQNPNIYLLPGQLIVYKRTSI